MTVLRSLVFMALAGAWTILLAIVYLPLLALPRRLMQRGARFWISGLFALLSTVCRLDYRVEGRSLPARGPAVVAANHQSAWDTLVFHLLCEDPVYLLKRELLGVPLFGWYLTKAGNIAIDRHGGAMAIRRMLPQVEQRLREGAQVIVFPEGTRTPPHQSRPFQPGVAAIYGRVTATVVPVALNSGLYWGRRKFLKFPGTIVLRVLSPLPHGLDRRRCLSVLEATISEARRALEGSETGASTGRT